MDMTKASGEAGAGLNLSIRGNRSISANNSPLIIVDGIPYGTNLDISSQEIESIEVLKMHHQLPFMVQGALTVLFW